MKMGINLKALLQNVNFITIVPLNLWPFALRRLRPKSPTSIDLFSKRRRRMPQSMQQKWEVNDKHGTTRSQGLVRGGSKIAIYNHVCVCMPTYVSMWACVCVWLCCCLCGRSKCQSKAPTKENMASLVPFSGLGPSKTLTSSLDKPRGLRQLRHSHSVTSCQGKFCL